MFDIGFTELLFVAVVALVVLGPDKLPTAVRTVGLWVGRIRRTVSSIQSDINEELRIDEMKRTASISKEELEKELNDMSTPFVETAEDHTSVTDTPRAADELQVEHKTSNSADKTANKPQSGHKP